MENHSLWDELQALILANSNPKKAAWLENYVKHGVKSLGVGIPVLKTLLADWIEKNNYISHSDESQILSWLDWLMSQQETEYKLLAILALQFHWQQQPVENRLQMIEKWFDQGWIFDWNVCDWLCVRLLTPLLDKHQELVLTYLNRWYKAAYLWKSRAALVTFAQAKNLNNLYDYFFPILNHHIAQPERFIKTSVGWLLREYSKFNPNFVINFLEQNSAYASNEVVKNAKKYIKS